MDFQATVMQMIMFFLVIAVGFTIKKLKVIEDSFDGQLSKLVLSVTMPCMILASSLVSKKPDDPMLIWMVFLFSIGAYAILMALAFLVPWLFRFKKADRGTYGFMVAFGNVGFIGFPVVGAIFGPEAIVYGAIFNIPFNTFLFTVGVFLISDSKDNLKERIISSAKNIISPTSLACFAAMAITLLKIDDSSVATQTLSLIGQITVPSALILIGSTLARYRIREMFINFRAFIIAAFRLFIGPIIIFFIFRLFIDDPILLGTIVLLSAMPVATNGALFCIHYGGNLKLMLQGTFITTLFSLASIPLLTLLFM